MCVLHCKHLQPGCLCVTQHPDISTWPKCRPRGKYFHSVKFPNCSSGHHHFQTEVQKLSERASLGCCWEKGPRDLLRELQMQITIAIYWKWHYISTLCNSWAFGHSFLKANTVAPYWKINILLWVGWTHSNLQEVFLYKYSMEQALLLLNPTEQSSNHKWPSALHTEVKPAVQESNQLS